MPEVFRDRGFRFFFYSNEGSPLEPIHIHAEKNGNEAKFWLFRQCRSPTMTAIVREPCASL
jgi:hypothetical protein